MRKNTTVYSIIISTNKNNTAFRAVRFEGGETNNKSIALFGKYGKVFDKVNIVEVDKIKEDIKYDGVYSEDGVDVWLIASPRKIYKMNRRIVNNEKEPLHIMALRFMEENNVDEVIATKDIRLMPEISVRATCHYDGEDPCDIWFNS